MDETILQQVAFLRHATTNWLKHWKSAILGMRGEKKQKLVWKFHRDGIFCENKMDENIMIANNMMKRFASVPLFQSKVKTFTRHFFLLYVDCSLFDVEDFWIHGTRLTLRTACFHFEIWLRDNRFKRWRSNVVTDLLNNLVAKCVTFAVLNRAFSHFYPKVTNSIAYVSRTTLRWKQRRNAHFVANWSGGKNNTRKLTIQLNNFYRYQMEKSRHTFSESGLLLVFAFVWIYWYQIIQQIRRIELTVLIWSVRVMICNWN